MKLTEQQLDAIWRKIAEDLWAYLLDDEGVGDVAAAVHLVTGKPFDLGDDGLNDLIWMFLHRKLGHPTIANTPDNRVQNS